MCVRVMVGGRAGGWGSLIETRQNIRFRSRIVKLLRNKSHSFHMTSPPCENVSFSGFKKKRTKCFHRQLQRRSSDKPSTTVEQSGTRLPAICNAFEYCVHNSATVSVFSLYIYIYIHDETAGCFPWGRVEMDFS